MINNYKEKQKNSKKKKKKKKQHPSNGDELAPTKGERSGGGLAGLMQLHTHHVFDLGVALWVGGLPLV